MRTWDKAVRRIAGGKPEPLEPDNRAVIAFACFVACAAIAFSLIVREGGGALMDAVEDGRLSPTYLLCAAGASIGVGIGVGLCVWWVASGAARSALDWVLDRTLRGRPH